MKEPKSESPNTRIVVKTSEESSLENQNPSISTEPKWEVDKNGKLENNMVVSQFLTQDGQNISHNFVNQNILDDCDLEQLYGLQHVKYFDSKLVLFYQLLVSVVKQCRRLLFNSGVSCFLGFVIFLFFIRRCLQDRQGDSYKTEETNPDEAVSLHDPELEAHKKKEYFM